MVKVKYLSPKHHAWAAVTKPDRIWSRRAVYMGCKIRSRRPNPTITTAWLNSRLAEDALALHPPQAQPFPIMSPVPLISPDRWRSLRTLSLERPAMPEIDPARIAVAQPGYKGLPPAHVRDGWIFLNYKALCLFRHLYVDPVNKKTLPNEYNVLVKDAGLASCPTHLFAVYGYAPSPDFGDPAARQIRRGLRFRRQVTLYPLHAAIWAAHCSRLPAIPAAKEDMPLKFIWPATDKRSAVSCLRMPVVGIPLPYPPKFFAIVMYVYTYSKGLFVGHLLPCPATPQILSEKVKAGDAEHTRFVQALAQYYKMNELCRLARNVYGTYRNMIALGMVDDRIWEALHFAWATLLEAMEIVDARGR